MQNVFNIHVRQPCISENQVVMINNSLMEKSALSKDATKYHTTTLYSPPPLQNDLVRILQHEDLRLRAAHVTT